MKINIPFDVIIANMSDLEIVKLQANCCQELQKRYTSAMEPKLLSDADFDIEEAKNIREAKKAQMINH